MNWKKNLWSLWFGCIISGSCYTMLVPFLPLYLLELGAAKATVSLWSGLIFSATFFVSALMSPYWGRRADRSGKRKMLLRAGFSLAAVYLLGAFVQSPLQLFCARFLQGFATGFVPAALALVASSVPEAKMGYSLGLMQSATLTGTIIGPLFGGMLSHFFGIRASFVVASSIMLMGTILVKLLVVEPNTTSLPDSESVGSDSIGADLRIALSNRPLREILVILMIAQMAIMLLQPITALFITELYGPADGVVLTSGAVFSLAGIAGAVAAPLWGNIGQKKGFLLIIIVGFIGAGIATSLFYIANTVAIFAVLQFIFGFFIAGVNPAVNTIAVQKTDSSFRGRVFGVIMCANQFGATVGPLIGGIISSCLGIKQTFLLTGLFLVFVGGIQGYFYYLRGVKIAEEKM